MRPTRAALDLIDQNVSLSLLKTRMLIRENKSEETLRRYVDGVKYFTKYMKAESPDAALKMFIECSDRTAKLDGFIDWALAERKKAVNIKALWHGIKKWLIVNRVNNIDWEYISRPKVSSQINDRIPTPEELKLILTNKVTLRDRALFMTSACSGLRLGTIITLKVKDYKPIEELGMITVEGGEGRKLAKGKSYFTFITPETRTILENYLNNRGTLNPSDPLFAKVDGGSLANYVQNISRQFTFLVKRAQLLERVPEHRWFTLHGHTLRKFFQTHCKLSGCRADFVDYWMGHHPIRSDEYLNDSYFRPDLEAHINEFRKAIGSLQVFSMDQKAIIKAEKEITNLQNELSSVKDRLSFYDSFIRLTDFVETKTDRERVLDLMENLRKEKEVKAYQQNQEDRAEIEKKLKKK